MSEENPKKKFICLHCGTVFESDKDAPYCPNCRRKRVIPLELLGDSLKKYRDKLKELGVLPESETPKSEFIEGGEDKPMAIVIILAR